MTKIADKKAPKAYAAFTLIELLVVISIIAVLMAVMMPSLTKAREQAKTVTCQANQKQFGLAMQMYATENKNTMMPMQTGGTTDGTAKLWMHYIAPYINSQKGAMRQTDGGYWANEEGKEIESGLHVFKCPAQTDKFYYNWYIKYGVDWIHASYAPEGITPRLLKLTQIKNLDKRLIVADSMDKDPKYVELTSLTQRMRGAANRYNPLYGQIGLQVFAYEEAEPYSLVSDRHKIGANALFLDGRVQWFKYEDLMFKKGEDTAERARKISMWDYRELKTYYNY